jgi:hypothetical protein
MINGDLEREYLWEMEFVRAEREHREWQEWMEEKKQKPAKIILLLPEKAESITNVETQDV